MNVNGENDKEVDFVTYCPKCVYWKKKENESPCDECLAAPTSLYSTKPLRFEERNKQKRRNNICQ